jgi:hypothetical protein
MELAYKFFSKSGCEGILKIDDDIKIVNTGILNHFIHTELNKYDYLGISIGNFVSDGNALLAVKKYNLNLFKTLRSAKANIVYAGGPFYWVSFKTIQYIAQDGLEYICEDVSVGNVVRNHSELRIGIFQNILNNVIIWNNESEA